MHIAMVADERKQWQSEPRWIQLLLQKIAQLGWNADQWCSGACTFGGVCPAVQSGYVNVGEQFKNCADVKVVDNGLTNGHSESNSELSPAPSTSVSTVAPPRRRRSPTLAPITSTSSCSGQPCAVASHCRSKWGYCGASDDYCNADSTWTAKRCSAMSADVEPEADPVTDPTAKPDVALEPEPKAEPEAEPEAKSQPELEAEPEAEPAAEPEAKPQAKPAEVDADSTACVAATAGLRRGVSSSHCSQCVGGYQWWPCNEETLCTCSAVCSWDGYWNCGAALGQIRSARHLRAAKPHHSSSRGSAFVQYTVESTSTSDRHEEGLRDEL